MKTLKDDCALRAMSVGKVSVLGKKDEFACIYIIIQKKVHHTRS
jgi:hypothetical protein